MRDSGAVRYLGWSGFRIEAPGPRVVLIDPPGAVSLSAHGPVHILLTHGHPEHVAGARRIIETPGHGPEIQVLASAALCRYLSRRCRRAAVSFEPLAPGDRQVLGESLTLEVFDWRHLPLLPPGAGPALRHLARLLGHPRKALRIITSALGGPLPGPMLGFDLDMGSHRVIAYGEGLHRRCRVADVAVRCRGKPADLLLAGIEPEDQQVVAGLISATGVGDVILYEPHSEWRRAFGMARADLTAIERELSAAGIRVVQAAGTETPRGQPTAA